MRPLGLFFIIFALRSIVICFCFQIYYSKNPKIPFCTFSLFVLFCLLQELFFQNHTNQSIFYPRGINNPSYASGCKYLFFVCRSYLRGVAWFSYWFDNLDLITEGNTYRSCAASSLPLGEIPTLFKPHLKEFLALLPGRIKSR